MQQKQQHNNNNRLQYMEIVYYISQRKAKHSISIKYLIYSINLNANDLIFCKEIAKTNP